MKNNVIKRLLPRLAAALLIGAGIFTHFALASAGEKAVAASEVDEPIERAAATEIPFVDAPNIFYGVLEDAPDLYAPDFKGRSVPPFDSPSSQAAGMLKTSLLKKNDFEYVDYYGGAFHAYDKDIYYVYITDLTKVPRLNRALGEYAEGVIFLPAKYGYNELMDIAERTSSELKTAGIRVSAWGADVYYKQKVIIYVLPEDLDAAREYVNKNCKNSELFEIEGMGYLECSTLPDPSDAETISLNQAYDDASDGAALKAAALLKGGMGMRFHKGLFDTRTAALGICGTYNGNPAFASCGHDISIGTVFYLSGGGCAGGTDIGNVIKLQYQNNGYGDFSIAKVITSRYQTSVYAGSYSIARGYLGDHMGMEVFGVLPSGKDIAGVVANVNLVATNPDGTTIKGFNIITTNNGQLTQSGDSGAPIIHEQSNEKYLFMGTVMGRHSTVSPPRNYVAYSPYEYLKNAGFTVAHTQHSFQYRYYNSTYHRRTCTFEGESTLQKHIYSRDDISAIQRCSLCGG